MNSYLSTCYKELTPGSTLLDVGCLGFDQYAHCESIKPKAFSHYGIDYCRPEHVPEGVHFDQVDLNKEALPYPDDFFDFVLAKHIIEHLRDPITFFSELIRVTKPGGKVYIEAPSERSLLLPQMPFQHDKFFSLSFFDDPTHMSRPWPPQALYRLSMLFGCTPLIAKHLISWKHRLLFPFVSLFALITRNGKLLERNVWQTVGWASFLLVQKPESLSGMPEFNYYIPDR